MKRATHAADTRARHAAKRAEESKSGIRTRLDLRKSVTRMSQRDHEIEPRESRAKRSRGAPRDVSRTFAGAATRHFADSKKHEL